MKPIQINKRQLLKLFGAVSATAIFPHHASAAQQNHPFARLMDINREAPFEETNDFMLALFMTAQSSYADCGGDFIGTRAVMDSLRQRGITNIRPVFILPRLSDQSQGVSERDNLNRALNDDLGFTILTGHLDDVVAAASACGAPYEQDQNRKISGHSRRAHFLTPGGSPMLSYIASNYLSPDPAQQISEIIQRCDHPVARLRGLCR